MASFEFTIEELQNEIWLAVVGYEDFYEVSNLGQVRSARAETGTKYGRILKRILYKGARYSHRYYSVALYKKKSKKRWLIHRLVALAFIGPQPEGCEINHIDGNKLNNRPENLEWVTHTDNCLHAVRLGIVPTGDRSGSRLHPELRPKGESHSFATFTDQEVLRIRERYAKGDISERELAREWGRPRPTISSILKRRTWKHI